MLVDAISATQERVRRRWSESGEIAVAAWGVVQPIWGRARPCGIMGAMSQSTRSGKRRRRLWIGMGGVLVVGLALWIVIREARTSDPVSIASVVERFRADGGSGADGAPAPGVYVYRVSGSEAGGAGVVMISRPFPKTASVTITPTSDGWETETNFSEQHIEATRLRIQGAAVVMTWRREDVTFAGLGRDDRRDIEGRYRIAPLTPRPGMTFSDVYRAGSLENQVTTRVVARESITVDGQPIAVARMRSRTQTEGALSGTREETLWWSPLLRIPVRSRLKVTIEGVVDYRSTIDMTLQSVEPLT